MNQIAQLFIQVSLLVMICLSPAVGQIFGPEGVNMPGSYDGWSNPPAVNSIAGIQKVGGTFLLDNNLLTPRYTTLIHVDAAAADLVGGSYAWLYTSGPSSNYYANKWGGVAVTMDNVQSYISGGADNSVTLTNGKYYTINFKDNGYANTSAIWIEMATQPVAITSVTQLPLAGSVTAGTPVTVTAVTSAPKSSEENVYVRYTTNNFATSALSEVSFVGTSGTASIPGQSGGTTVKYYAFSTKAVNPSADFDLLTIRYNNSNGSFYTYTIPAPTYTITATSGANGAISPSGAVLVTSGGNQTFTMLPAGGYYVDSLMVDNAYAGDSTSYTFTNVTANHTIGVVFAHNVNITFRVDLGWKTLQGNFVPASDDVLVRGTFNGFGTGDTVKDLDADTIYTKSISLKAGSAIEYKFYKSLRGGLAWEDNISNRMYTVPDNDATLPLVFFDNDIPPAPTVLVTFQVDMSVKMMYDAFQPDSGDLVTVRGSFNDWGNSTNNPDTLRDLDGDSVYNTIVGITGNQTIEYKFWKTLRSGEDYESLVSNRSFDVELSNATLPAPFFSNDSVSPFYSMNVSNKWNLLSVPRNVGDPRAITIFPTAVSSAYGYNAAYYTEDSLESGTGYWLKFGGNESVTIFGPQILSKSINVIAGWNIIGGISRSVAVSSILQSPANNVKSSYFTYNNGYQPTATLQPGGGYWVKVDSNGTLTLNAPTAVQAPISIAGVEPRFADMITLIVEDAGGNSQSLYIGNELPVNRKASSYEAPPIPPLGVFDVRFGSGTMAEFVQPGIESTIPIELNSAEYPVTIKWSGGEGVSGTSLSLGSKSFAMRSEGSAVIRSAGGRIAVSFNSERELPEVFSLGQNYPNPFNPVTTIEFGLPEECKVSLKVFNLLGQEVGSLLDDARLSGWQSIQWDASGAASGLYFYRIVATSTANASVSFTRVKAMTLLR